MYSKFILVMDLLKIFIYLLNQVLDLQTWIWIDFYIIDRDLWQVQMLQTIWYFQSIWYLFFFISIQSIWYDSIFKDFVCKWRLYNKLKPCAYSLLLNLGVNECWTCNKVWAKYLQIRRSFEKWVAILVMLFNFLNTFETIHNRHV